MGAGSSFNVDDKIHDQKDVKKSELQELEDRITEIDNFIKERDSVYSLTENTEETEKIIMKSIETITKIHDYAEILYKRLLVLREKTEQLLKDKQKAMVKLVNQLRAQNSTNTGTFNQYQNTKYVIGEDWNSTFVGKWNSGHKETLGKILNKSNNAKQNQSLQAIIDKAMSLLNDLKNKSEISNTDVNMLHELLKKWTLNAKIFEEVEKEEEEKKRLDKEREEKQKKIEEDKKKEEEEKRRRLEEEEQKKREEEEERLRREEEDRRKKEEEEKRKREDEEKQRLEEEEIKKREEEERIKREEEERKRREEEERRKREEEERQRREEEERRKRKEEETKRKEEEDKERRRLNPLNWKPFIYEIQEQNLIDEYNDDVCCVVCAIPGAITKDDLCCSSSGHNDYNIRECISDEEQICSLMVNIQTYNHKECILERPLRVYIPHCHGGKDNREVSVKVSINGGKWKQIKTLETYILTEKKAVNFTGFEIEKFISLKIIAVTRIKSERIMVSEDGMNYKCIGDKDVSVVFPDSVFKQPTEVSLRLNTVPKTDLKSAKENHNNLSQVMDSTSVISIDCFTSTENQFHLKVQGLGNMGYSDRFNSVYKERDGEWKFADQKIIDKVAYITIPAGVSNIRLIGLTLPSHTPNILVFDSANEMVKHSNETKVQVICKQKNSNWNDTHIACVATENKKKYANDLVDNGYSDGPAPSREFCVTEGENIHFWCSGNIAAELPRSSLRFLKNYQDCLSCHLSVRDLYIQKQEQYYRGYLQFKVDDSNGSFMQQRKDQLCLYLEKQDVSKKSSSYSTKFKLETKVTALIKYIALKFTLEECEEEAWDQFVHCLDTENKVRKLKKTIDRDYQYDTSRKKYEEFLKLWIREKEKSINKIGVITSALNTCQLDDMEFEARRFLDFYDGIFSDISLIKMAEKIGAEWETLGINLHLTTAEIDQIKMDNPNSRNQIIHMLDNWRVSDHAVECDKKIISELVKALHSSNCDSNLIDYITQMYPDDIVTAQVALQDK